MCENERERDRETYIRRGTEGRVGEGGREGGVHSGFVCIISIQIGHRDLQRDVLLVSEWDHRHPVIPAETFRSWPSVLTSLCGSI